MTCAEVRQHLVELGLKDLAATSWATKLTADGREPTQEEVTSFAEKTLPAVRKAIADRKANRPFAEILTTPEEKFSNS